MKKIFSLILEPIKFLGNRGFAEKIVNFFDKYPFLVHILAFVTTIAILFVKYVVPNL